MFFSDRENGPKNASIEKINIAMWNGIVAIFHKYVSNNSFSKNFPIYCQDHENEIIGCNTLMMSDKAKALIPNINVPIARISETVKVDLPFGEEEDEENSGEIDTFSVLDFIEFCFQNLNDPHNKDFHNFFKHYHLEFKSTFISRNAFRNEINELFERNGIAFKLTEEGQIIRIISSELASLVATKYQTEDTRLNELLEEATSSFILPKAENRYRAIEKLWDAFERLKTYCHENKSISMEQFLTTVSNGNAHLKTYLNEEAKTLTKIGNEFQIRHFERDKHEIKEDSHLDYLFHRLLSLIHLMISKI